MQKVPHLTNDDRSFLAIVAASIARQPRGTEIEIDRGGHINTVLDEIGLVLGAIEVELRG